MNELEKPQSKDNSLVIAIVVISLLSLVFGGVYLINQEERRREEQARHCYFLIVNGYATPEECPLS
jgi:hypothetical protein